MVRDRGIAIFLILNTIYILRGEKMDITVLDFYF